MSRNIEVDAVTSVLLADGKWHNVQDQSFHTASYEFHSKGESGHGGGQGGVWPTGFSFKSGGEVLYGPLAAIVAVKTKAHE